MNSVIFRQYDIRAKIGSDLKLEEVYDLARAIIYFFKEQDPSMKRIALGMDGRTHSPVIKDEFCRVLREAGYDVAFIGTCPTPVLYFALHNMPVDGGLMITASHNGPEYNGVKMSIRKESVWGKSVQTIKQYVEEKKHVASEMQGLYEEIDAITPYIAWLKNHFSHLVGMNLSGMIDCGNGAAGTVLPQLVEAMEWKQVSLLYPEVDGTYPNHEADPTVAENMEDLKKVVLSGEFDVGVGFDGDCDRMAPITHDGQLVSGDKLLAIFAQEILKNNPGGPIVFDIKCSSGLAEIIQQWGGQPLISPSGHSIIKDALKNRGALLAGELSCHFFFKDRYFGYDDGIYSALRLFELLIKSKKTLRELLTVFPERWSTPEIRIDCDEQKVDAIVEHVKNHFASRTDTSVMTIDGVRVSLKDGWGMVRASHTQPVICLRFEANSPENLQQIKDDFSVVLEPHLKKSDLDRYLL